MRHEPSVYFKFFVSLVTSVLVGSYAATALVRGISMVYLVLDIKCWVFQPATRAPGYIVGFLRIFSLFNTITLGLLTLCCKS